MNKLIKKTDLVGKNDPGNKETENPAPSASWNSRDDAFIESGRCAEADLFVSPGYDPCYTPPPACTLQRTGRMRGLNFKCL